MKASNKKTWYVQPADGSWIDGAFYKQSASVQMSEDEAKYLAMANIIGDKPVVKEAPAPVPADGPAEKPAKKAGSK